MYAAVDLNAPQKARLLAAIQNADDMMRAAAREPVPQGGYETTACVFDPHHTITFIRKGKPSGELSVCFECSKLAWNGDDGAPQVLMGALPGFIKQIGLQPKRDWHGLATKAATAAAVGKSEKRR